ncbi:hypothetical protein [Pseudarthrobacter sp. NS4]|uniref:hypothetical protein n=1 Tax=Pseudarthrobacter sp. NS4 TaxID=2973976 RepID=UPI002161A3D5|nr:hypothetical protein [Pseudarthrobacter sp. NS4]
MNAEIAGNALLVITVVMAVWFLLGWAIYGGGRGKARKGGIFEALYKFVVIPWLVTAAAGVVLLGVFWGFLAATGSFN